MKIIFRRLENVVLEIFENVTEIEIIDNGVIFAEGSLKMLELPPLILEDNVEIELGDSITPEIEALNQIDNMAKELSSKELVGIMNAVRHLIRADELSTDELFSIMAIFPRWDSYLGKTMTEGITVRYEDLLYKVITEHKSQAHLNPVDANYLFAKITPPGLIEPWERRDYTNPYTVGEKVLWEGEIYELIQGGTAYSYTPTEYPAGWKLIP